PTLTWIGKDKVVNHHHAVPYRVLEHKYGFRSDNDDRTPTNIGNRIIHGDNLEALKSLLPEYGGRIKCIYIDPPYNTGNEKWVYNDNVNDPKIKRWLGEVVGKPGEDLSRHDKWLCMMYPRLKLLHKLLADDGAIFISIDDNELANLRLICDQIFGANNFVTQFIWHTEGHTDNQDPITHVHEYVCLYAKDKNSLNIIPTVDPNTPEDSKILRNFAENSITKNGPKNPPKSIILPAGFPCEAESLQLPASERIDAFITELNDGYINREITAKYNVKYPARLNAMIVENSRLKQPCEVFSGWMNANKLQQFIDNGCRPINDKGSILQFYLSKNGVIYYLRTNRGCHYVQTVLQNMGTTETNKYLLERMNVIFDYPKPVELITYLTSLIAPKNAIILDSFAGSGTTAHAVINLNQKDGGDRKFILVEMDEFAEDITAKRVRQVMRGYGKGKSAVAGTGGAFDYYELGEPLFDKEQNLNKAVSEDKIREYIYYTETKQHLERERTEASKYLLDTYNNTGYYFYYERDQTTTLSIDTLHIITERAEQYVVYADVCTVPPQVLAAYNITFKKITRDIKRF
ncbi:MAG: site-specific DNA-methyltransferase, partial [Muribaculaceae bacterium]|nr:site-specific DNA-methyltransferase [Muribaculaceae bacterium]